MDLAKVVIIFDNFGPYHWARLKAAAEICNLLAIEVFDHAEHGWIQEQHSVPFRTMTLARNAKGREIDLPTLTQGLEEALDEFQPQVVFIPGWSCAAAFCAQIWCAGHSVPVVVMSESNRWDEKRSSLKEWVKRRLAGMYSAALVGGSPHVDYLAELGLPLSRIFLGYDAVDNDFFGKKTEEVRKINSAEATGETSSMRNQYGLRDRYFLASARFVAKKNLLNLIHAYARYRQLAFRVYGSIESKPWNLVLLGDGPLKSELNREVAKLNLEDSISLKGFTQYAQLPLYYALASAFVHASSTEQWGLVVNEAMASGLPVLVSDRCGCTLDLVNEGANGFAFDPLDVEQLGELMLRLSISAEPKLPYSGAEPRLNLETMGQASREIISQWGLKRFAAGVQSAAAKALAIGPQPLSLLDNLLLKLLVVRY